MSWESVKIPDVLFFQEGPGVRNTQFTNHGVKLLNVGNINFGNLNLDATKIYISDEEAYGKYKHFLVDEGDLLIASSGIVVNNFHNKITWASKEHLPLCLNTSTIRFKTLDPNVLDIRYFSYFLKTRLFADQLAKLITGSAQLNFGSSHLKQISLPLPPLATQKRIAEILDAADALRRKDQELLKKYDELAQAIFIDMFGDPVKNEKGWEIKKLNEITESQDNMRVPIESSLRDNRKGNFPYYGASGIIDYVDDFLFEGLRLLISEDGANLLARNSPIAFIASGKYWVNNHAHVLFSDDYSLLKYLEFWFNLISIKPYVTGSAQPKLNGSKLMSIRVPIPEKINLRKFLNAIERLDEQTPLIGNSGELFQSLIQKAFKGELVA